MLVADFTEICGALSPTLAVYMATEDVADEEGGAPQPISMPVVRIGHHRPPEVIDANVPVELFTSFWRSEGGIAITLQAILAEFGTNHTIADHVRIAVPTDQGHHRILDILKLGINKLPSGSLIVEITAEPWNSLHQIIRTDEE